MFLSDFIEKNGITFDVGPASDGMHNVTVIRAGRTVEACCAITPGREFSGVAFLAAMQASFRKLEAAPDGGSDESGLSTIRDDFRNMLGPSAYSEFLRVGRGPRVN